MKVYIDGELHFLGTKEDRQEAADYVRLVESRYPTRLRRPRGTLYFKRRTNGSGRTPCWVVQAPRPGRQVLGRFRTRWEAERKMRELGLRTITGGLLLAAPAANAQAPVNLFGNAVPNNPDIADDTAGVSLGVKFYSSVPGTVAGIRFYRAAANPAGYRVRLYTAGGTRLASARVAADTCLVPCWEEVDFAAPVSITANATYIADYYTSNGNYADDDSQSNGGAGSFVQGVVNGPLVVPASGAVGGNGVYTYSTGFPTQVWNASNYYVDVAFTPAAGTPPTLSLSFSPTAPSVSANAPIGTVVATVTASWSDGSPFTGAYGFGLPYSNDSGAFALNGNQLVVAGPLTTDAGIPQNITITATQ